MTESPTHQSLGLPMPDAVALAHTDKLKHVLTERIQQAGGSVSFADYMSAALYEPGLGYYMAGTAKFGSKGDFITAPEVSPLFGQTLANQILPILVATSGSILELGAGSGRLALSIMQTVAQRQNVRYFILEPSAELAQRQQRFLQQSLLAEQFAAIEWLDTLPESFTGVVLANEVMDALPVERFRIDGLHQQRQLQQLRVSDSLTSVVAPANSTLTSAIEQIEHDLGYELPDAYESEVCTTLTPWIRSLSACLSRGVLLLIDYGYPRKEYYLPERRTGTLACYYQHRAHDNPYLWPGLHDITAHVDFTAVAEAGVAGDLELLGYTSQSSFLLNSGLLDAAETCRQNANEQQQFRLAKAVKTLTLPGEMGERFQVMALGKAYDEPPSGFQALDLSHRL